MRIEIEIPKEFEEHFKQDKFKDSFERIMVDIWHSLEIGNCLCAGNYEYETIKMLEEALENSKSAYSVDKVVEELLALNKNYNDGINLYEEVAEIPTEEVIEIVKQGGVSDDTDNVCEWKRYPSNWFVGCDGCKVKHKQGNYCPRCGRKIKIVGD